MPNFFKDIHLGILKSSMTIKSSWYLFIELGRLVRLLKKRIIFF